MTKLTIDFETRSASDLPSVGSWRYSRDPTTGVLCLAWMVDDESEVSLSKRMRGQQWSISGCGISRVVSAASSARTSA